MRRNEKSTVKKETPKQHAFDTVVATAIHHKQQQPN